MKNSDPFINFPSKLRKLPQWVVWRYEQKEGRDRKDKVPYKSNDTRVHADTTRPDTWSSFTEAVYAYEHEEDIAGIGFVLKKENGVVGIDLDHCRDLETGELEAWARQALDHLDTYCEVSPSGSGVHAFVYGDIPKALKRDGYEFYCEGRFLTVTGEVLSLHDSAMEREIPLLQLYEKVLGTKVDKSDLGLSSEVKVNTRKELPVDQLADPDIFGRIKKSKQAPEFGVLWTGKWKEAGYTSQSEADMRLTQILAWWLGGNEPRMNQWFKRSKLYRPKWDEDRGGQTYGQITINKAIAACEGRYFDPLPRKKNELGEVKRWESDTPRDLCTHKANAYIFMQEHHEVVRFFIDDKGRGGDWYTWDGKMWVLDNMKARVLMSGVSEKIYEQAALLSDTEEGSSKEKGRLMSWARQSDMENVQSASLHAAERNFYVPSSLLDGELFKINMPNGTFDLDQGVLLDHNRDDFFTTSTSFEYDPHAKCPIWEEYLKWVFISDESMIQFMRRLIGYTLSGSTDEQKMFMFYGGGRNGKGTVLRTVRAMMGEKLAGEAPNTLIMEQRHEGHPTELASLRGKRMVICSELSRGQAFSESRLKQLTGNKHVATRGMYENFRNQRIDFKLFVETNYKPIVKDPTHAFWQRMVIIPFLATFDRIDMTLESRLLAELPGIFNWAVEGYHDWKKMGLSLPDTVMNSIEEYHETQDHIVTFMRENLTTDEDSFMNRGDLYEKYTVWKSKQDDESPLISKIDFYERVGAKFRAVKIRGERGFRIKDFNILRF
jgi:putative DNA primase/helicase